MDTYDAIIIGSGPGGQKAAIASAKLGKTVALIESWDLGGSSLHTATVPSKTLREAILELTGYKNRNFYQDKTTALNKGSISIKDLNHRIEWVKSHLKATLKHDLKKNGVKIYTGHAKFLSPHEIQISLRDGDTITLKADKIFLATGSKPRTPEKVPFDGKRVLNSTDFLSMDRIPKSLVVIGAGIIGCEYASMMCILGVKVTLVDKRKHLLPFLDSEVALHLQVALEENNLTFIGEKECDDICTKGEKVIITLSDGSKIPAEKVLVAAGREANVKNLDIDKAHITLNKRGYIDVSPNFQTKRENIYAVGDVIGGPCLASTAYIQGVFAVNCAFSNNVCKQMNIYPYGIYTIPEISYIGETEESLKEKGIPYEVGRAYFYEISRCIITGNKTGLCKLIFDRKNFRLLGAHIIGRGATEVIHIAQLAISLNAKIHYFVDHVFNFPTYAEMYAIAARNGINKVKQEEEKNEEKII